MSNLLDDLFFKYKADKTPRIKHHYSDVYFDLFKDKREKVKKVLEIGTAEGASLFAWRDFFPNAMIYGMEVDQKRVDMFQGLVGIQVFKTDQGNSSSLLDAWDEIIPGSMDLDLVVDDGSHKTSDQLFTALTLAPLLLNRNNGVYVIEDVHEGEVIEQYLNHYFEFQYDIKLIKCGERWDDNLIIIKNYV